MSKVLELVQKSKDNSKGRKTKNQEEYLSILTAVLTDEEYVTENLSEIKDGEIIIDKKHIAPGFLKIAAAAFRSAGNSEEEAMTAARNLKITKEMATSIVEAVRETDFLVIHECGKKIQLFKKPGLEVNLLIADAKESEKPNPRNKDEKVRIKARKKVRAEHVIHDFQRLYVDKDGKVTSTRQ